MHRCDFWPCARRTARTATSGSRARPAVANPPSADMALSDLSFEYEDSVLGPMTPWQDKITVLDGLDTQVSKENDAR